MLKAKLLRVSNAYEKAFVAVSDLVSTLQQQTGSSSSSSSSSNKRETVAKKKTTAAAKETVATDSTSVSSDLLFETAIALSWRTIIASDLPNVSGKYDLFATEALDAWSRAISAGIPTEQSKVTRVRSEISKKKNSRRENVSVSVTYAVSFLRNAC